MSKKRTPVDRVLDGWKELDKSQKEIVMSVLKRDLGDGQPRAARSRPKTVVVEGPKAV